MTTIAIRPEASGDEQAIFDVTEAAFKDMPFSDGAEPSLVNQLRADGDLTLSLVAETPDAIVGHIAFSPVTISDGSEDWYGLGPVSVAPELQGNAIGSRLVALGMTDLRERCARGIILLGNPEYYSRFGFEHDPALRYPGPPAEFFQRIVLKGDAPSGIVTYAKAFG